MAIRYPQPPCAQIELIIDSYKKNMRKNPSVILVSPDYYEKIVDEVGEFCALSINGIPVAIYKGLPKDRFNVI